MVPKILLFHVVPSQKLNIGCFILNAVVVKFVCEKCTNSGSKKV